MCFVDAATSNLEIDQTELGDEYKCLDCESKFKAIGKKIKCPTCESTRVKKL